MSEKFSKQSLDLEEITSGGLGDNMGDQGSKAKEALGWHPGFKLGQLSAFAEIETWVGEENQR